MKVKIVKQTVAQRKSAHVGDELDLPEMEARNLIASGRAVAVGKAEKSAKALDGKVDTSIAKQEKPNIEDLGGVNDPETDPTVSHEVNPQGESPSRAPLGVGPALTGPKTIDEESGNAIASSKSAKASKKSGAKAKK